MTLIAKQLFTLTNGVLAVSVFQKETTDPYYVVARRREKSLSAVATPTTSTVIDASHLTIEGFNGHADVVLDHSKTEVIKNIEARSFADQDDSAKYQVNSLVRYTQAL